MIRTITAAALVMGVGAPAALAQAEPEFTLRLQTHLSAETLAGKNMTQFFEDIETMSGGRIKAEGFFSSAVVKSAETFDATINGILDADFTTGAYQVGKDPAFQFVGDPMGGYDTPWQLYAFLYNGGGLERARQLYKDYGMYLVGWYIQSAESLNSTKPLTGPDSLSGFKFRSPPGMITNIFSSMGASPIVMDFTEVFTALESGIIDGADAASISTNQSLGIYDIAKHTTYPGFHSMPALHLAIRLDLWESMPDDLKRILEVGMQKFAFRTTLDYAVDNQRAANQLAEAGVTLHDWSEEDRTMFRERSVAAWDEFATTDEAKEIVAQHKDFMGQIGLLDRSE